MATAEPVATTRDTPADTVIRAFGGVTNTTRAINAELVRAQRDPIHFTTVSKWRLRGGNVHYRWHPWILRATDRKREIVPAASGGYTVVDDTGRPLTGVLATLAEARRLLHPRIELDDLTWQET